MQKSHIQNAPKSETFEHEHISTSQKFYNWLCMMNFNSTLKHYVKLPAGNMYKVHMNINRVHV